MIQKRSKNQKKNLNTSDQGTLALKTLSQPFLRFILNPKLKKINEILKKKSLPEYSEFFNVLMDVTECLENESESYRPKNVEGNCGGLVDFFNEEKLTVVVPDLHARTDFLLKILNAKLPELCNLTVFDALEKELLRLVFVGDILHSETKRNRWLESFFEFEKEDYCGKNMCEEMGEGLSVLEVLCRLKILFPRNVQILKGNHENILNRTEDGDFGFKKFTDEGEMCRCFVQNFYGDDILFLIHCFEKSLPIVFVGKNLVVSHAEPKEAFSRNQIINANCDGNVVKGFTWTANGEALNGSVEGVIKNLIENESPSENIMENFVYLAGHRPVPSNENFCLRQDGLFVQIHNPLKQNVAVVIPGKKFNPENDIVEL